MRPGPRSSIEAFVVRGGLRSPERARFGASWVASFEPDPPIHRAGGGLVFTAAVGAGTTTRTAAPPSPRPCVKRWPGSKRPRPERPDDGSTRARFVRWPQGGRRGRLVRHGSRSLTPAARGPRREAACLRSRGCAARGAPKAWWLGVATAVPGNPLRAGQPGENRRAAPSRPHRPPHPARSRPLQARASSLHGGFQARRGGGPASCSRPLASCGASTRPSARPDAPLSARSPVGRPLRRHGPCPYSPLAPAFRGAARAAGAPSPPAFLRPPAPRRAGRPSW
jgi:hypothetical protein